MRSDGDDRHAGGGESFVDGGQDAAADRRCFFAGHVDGREQCRIQVDGRENFGRPVARAGVKHLGGGGDGVFGAHFSAQPVGEEVGEEKDISRDFHGGRGGGGEAGELEEGIEGHGLDAGDAIEFFFGEACEDGIDHAIGAGIAIADGIGDECGIFIKQGEINAPDINADAFNVVFGGVFGQAGLDFVPVAEDIPVKRVAFGVVEANLQVGKAMDLDEAVIPASDNSPTMTRPDSAASRSMATYFLPMHFSLAGGNCKQKRGAGRLGAGISGRHGWRAWHRPSGR